MKRKKSSKVLKKSCAIILLAFCFVLIYTKPVKAAEMTFELNRYYYIASAENTNLVLDVSGGSIRDGANIQLWNRNGTGAQLFKIVESSKSGYYCFVNKNSGKVIDIEGGFSAAGTNVQQYQKNDTQAQNWKLYRTEDSKAIYIVAECGKFLDVSGGIFKAGSNVWIYDDNRTAAQRFVLIPYINYEYKTVTLEFDDVVGWQEEIERANRSVSGYGSYQINPSGNVFYNGKIIVNTEVLEWKTIEVKVPASQGPGVSSYKTEYWKLPYKIRYELHSHDDRVRCWLDFSKASFWQQCDCGYRDSWSCELPWPDLTKNSDTQTTESVIKHIQPQFKVLWTIR